MIDRRPRNCKAFNSEIRVKGGLVRCRMEVQDVSIFCQTVELKSLLDGLARHLVGTAHHAFVNGDMSGKHSIVIFAAIVCNRDFVSNRLKLSTGCT